MVEQAERTTSRTLTLATLAGPADYIEIDGQRFELVDTARLSLRERARVKKLMDRIETLERKDEPTEADEQEHLDKARELAHAAIPEAPIELLHKLAEQQLAELATAFFVWAATRSQQMDVLQRAGGWLPKLKELKPSPTSDGSSPTSRSATAATPSAGSN